MDIKVILLIGLYTLVCLGILISPVSASDLQLEWNSDYCDTDFDCDINYICITAYTDDDLFSLSSKSDANVFAAQKLNKEGKCARVYYQIDDDNKVYYDRYIGTQSIPKTEEVEECPIVEECPVCENKTIEVPIEKVVYKNNWIYDIILFSFFACTIIIMFFVMRNRIRKHMLKKINDTYGKQIKQLENLKKQFPSFGKSIEKEKIPKAVEKNYDFNIKTLTPVEMERKIKESEGK